MKTKNKILARLATLGAALFTLALPCRASDIQNPSPATAATTPGGAANSIQFNNGGSFGGFGSWNGTTFTVPGAANSLNFAGSSTGNPVTLTATGSDADIDIQLVPKVGTPVGAANGAVRLPQFPGFTLAGAIPRSSIPYIANGGITVADDPTSDFPGSNSYMNWLTASSDNSVSGFMQFIQTRGTIASPTASLTGDTLGTISALGYANGDYQVSSRIAFVQDGAVSGSTVPGAIDFYTHLSGGPGGTTRRMRINNAGTINIYSLTNDGFVKTSGGDGTLSVDTATYLTASANKVTTSTVSGLPTCDGGAEGTMRGVTDALLPTYLATVTGGGAVHAPVYCNGSNWIGM